MMIIKKYHDLLTAKPVTIFQDSELRIQEMMVKFFEEQRKADMADREKD